MQPTGSDEPSFFLRGFTPLSLPIFLGLWEGQYEKLTQSGFSRKCEKTKDAGFTTIICMKMECG